MNFKNGALGVLCVLVIGLGWKVLNPVPVPSPNSTYISDQDQRRRATYAFHFLLLSHSQVQKEALGDFAANQDWTVPSPGKPPSACAADYDKCPPLPDESKLTMAWLKGLLDQDHYNFPKCGVDAWGKELLETITTARKNRLEMWHAYRALTALDSEYSGSGDHPPVGGIGGGDFKRAMRGMIGETQTCRYE